MDCGCKMYGQFDRKKSDPRKKIVYICPSYYHGIAPPEAYKPCQTAKRIPEAKIDQALEAYKEHIKINAIAIEDHEDEIACGLQAAQEQLALQRKQLEAELAAFQLRKSKAARSLLLLADAQPEIIEAAKKAYAEIAAEERALDNKSRQAASAVELETRFFRVAEEHWQSAVEGRVFDLVARIEIHFQTRKGKARKWKNFRGELRGGTETVRARPKGCSITPRSMARPELEIPFPYLFNHIVTTEAQCSPYPDEHTICKQLLPPITIILDAA